MDGGYLKNGLAVSGSLFDGFIGLVAARRRA